MIGYLKGQLITKQPPQLLLEVNGVGYEVEAPMSTFYELPETGEAIALHTHLVVREDAHILFGFASLPERSLFRSLIKINGVGPRMALGILSGISVDGFTRCVNEGDTASLTRVPGVGKKTAERLIVEMRDKLAADNALPGASHEPIAASPRDEALAALLALGYRPGDAERMVRSVKGENLSSEIIIRQSLQGSAR
ncbi:MAG TPA: Holliday junction branch migration protein RuvA [Gammaproteobacteria bacterium]|nr:Holliday junction branch migration protein RuvA [Gammaproteobacteria bacterium]